MKSFHIFLLGAIFCLSLCVQTASAVISFDKSYYSPLNSKRPLRKSTSLIVLHTTEAPSKSALQKLSALGECNYCIDEKGRVYLIIDRQREAFHAGRSMWNGRTNVDKFSVGIEVCGYHDKALTTAQFRALADLIAELKHCYKIPDHCIIPHSQVAYATPNKWFTRSHRGRKRCGMMFALPVVRRLLGLKTRPGSDPDVKAGRLIVGDKHLSNVLYGTVQIPRSVVAAAVAAQKKQPPEPPAKKTKADAAQPPPTNTKKSPPGKKQPSAPPPAVPPPIAVASAEVDAIRRDEGNVIGKNHSAWDIARNAYNNEHTVYTFPDGTKKCGHQIIDFKSIPVGTKVEVNVSDENLPDTYQIIGINGTAEDIAGEETLSFQTIYVCPDGHYFRGNQLNQQSLKKLRYNTKVLTGYSVGGPVTVKRTPTDICGAQWRAKDTFYLINNRLVPGNQVDEKKIPSGTMVFYRS